tara:strand:- start:524 stop:736 length:213 start_codon:yes stop_codon:yes gene_type:complete
MNKIKWVGTIFVLSGILFTNLNIYPVNIFTHGFGVILWTAYGIISKDKAISTNFGFQIPLFGLGIANYLI